MGENFSNALKLEALLCAAAEVMPYAKEEFVKAAMANFDHLPRNTRRKEEKNFNEGFINLHRILTKFSQIVERDNPEFFDRVVDRLVEQVNNPKTIKW